MKFVWGDVSAAGFEHMVHEASLHPYVCFLILVECTEPELWIKDSIKSFRLVKELLIGKMWYFRPYVAKKMGFFSARMCAD